MKSARPDFNEIPTPTWGAPLRHRVTPEGHVIHAQSPGLLHSPPARRLLLAGVLVFGTGLFIFGGAWIAAFRKFELSSILVLLLGGGIGGLIMLLGFTALRWGVAAAWGVTEISLTADRLIVQRLRPFSSRVEVARTDFRSVMVTDQFQLAFELLVTAAGHRVVRVLSGRSAQELGWLASLITVQFEQAPEAGNENEE